MYIEKYIATLEKINEKYQGDEATINKEVEKLDKNIDTFTSGRSIMLNVKTGTTKMPQEEYINQLNTAIQASHCCDNIAKQYIGETIFEIKDYDYLALLKTGSDWIEELAENFMEHFDEYDEIASKEEA